MVTHCGHHFHDHCLVKHFERSNFCPYDRRELFQYRENFGEIAQLKDLYAVLPDVVTKLQSEHYIEQMLEKKKIIQDEQIVSFFATTVIRVITKDYKFWLKNLLAYYIADRWIQALSFSDQAIAYYATARFIDRVKSRLGLKVWLEFEKSLRRRLDAFSDYKVSEGYIGGSEEDWFLDIIVPDHSFTGHIAYIFGRQYMTSVSYIEASIKTVGEVEQDTFIVVRNPGEDLDLRFGHGKDGLRIQLLHGQILKITDSPGAETLSQINIDINIEDDELFLEDSAGTLYTFVFKFE